MTAPAESATGGAKGLRIKTLGNLISVLLLVVAATVVGTSHFTLSEVGGMGDAWRDYDKGVGTKVHILHELGTALGFGGMIHQFKNFVLRQDRLRIVAIQSKILDASVALTTYVALGLNEREREAIGQLQKSVEQYMKVVAVAERMVSEGKTSREIDAAVKVDDTRALEALALLDDELEQAHRASTKRLHSSVSFVQDLVSRSEIVVGILLAILVICFLWFTRTRLVTPLAQLGGTMEALAGGDLDVEIPGFDRDDEIGAMAKTVQVFKENAIQRKRAEREVRTRAYQQGAVADLGRRALTGTDPIDLMQQAATIVALTLNVELCTMLEVEPDGESLIFRAGSGWRGASNDSDIFASGARSHFGYTLGADGPVVSEDLARERRFKTTALTDEYGVVSGATVLIEGKDQVYGVLGVHARRSRSFTEDDINFLLTVANAIAATLERGHNEKERHELTERFHKSQKFEAMGTLAGGVAHDFNNILGIIVGNSELALGRVDEGSAAQDHLSEILRAADRAQGLVQQILAFGRPQDARAEPVEISEIVDETVSMARSTLPASISIGSTVTAIEKTVLVDPTQMHQVLMNLCINASHAIGDSMGEIKVAVTNVDVSGRCADRLAAQGKIRSDKAFHSEPLPDGEGSKAWAGLLKSGRHVVVTVEDTGCGMDGEVLDRILDPFFTTKPVGEGSGLGLAAVHGIVTGHGGAIVIETRPGKGTRFEIYLPCAETVVATTKKIDEAVVSGSERILIVDDEEALVRVGRRTLERFGYTVAGAVGGLNALEVFREAPGDWDVVITDHTMPDMTGTALAQEIRRLRGDIPIILCTGFKKGLTEEGVRKFGIQRLLTKPVIGRDLAAAVRSVLDDAA